MKEILVFSVLLFISIPSLLLGNQELDSLKQELELNKEDSKRLKILQELAALSLRLDLDQSRAYSHEAIILSEQLKDDPALAAAYMNLGLTYCIQGDFAVCLEHSLKALALSEKIGEQASLAKIYHNIAGIYLYTGELRSAIELARKAVTINKELGDSIKLSENYTALSSAYMKLYGEWDEESEYTKDSLILEGTKHLEEALSYFKEVKNQKGIALCYSRITAFELRNNNFLKSIEYGKKALALIEKNDLVEAINTHYYLGTAYLHTDELALAEKHLLTAYKESKEKKRKKTILNATESLYLLYAKKEDYKSFNKFHKENQAREKEQRQTEKEQKTRELKEKYESEKKTIENERLAYENQAIQTRFRLSSIIGSLLFGLLGISIFFFLKLRKNRNQLENINKEKNKLFAILAHDLRNPISGLSGLSEKVKFLVKKNRLDELDEMARQTDDKLAALNDNLNNILYWAITETNLISIKPEKISLNKELENITNLYSDVLDRKNLIVKNNIDDSFIVNADIRVTQTIIRNLINNAIKFSYPKGLLEFSAIAKGSFINLNIKDNGIGLPAGESKESQSELAIRNKAAGSGIGLKISRELADKSGIQLKLISNVDGGTTGVVRFPIVA